MQQETGGGLSGHWQSRGKTEQTKNSVNAERGQHLRMKCWLLELFTLCHFTPVAQETFYKTYQAEKWALNHFDSVNIILQLSSPSWPARIVFIGVKCCITCIYMGTSLLCWCRKPKLNPSKTTFYMCFYLTFEHHIVVIGLRFNSLSLNCISLNIWGLKFTDSIWSSYES